MNEIVRRNLMTIRDYTPYCGDIKCCMPRSKFNGEQFECVICDWKSSFPKEFVDKYKAKWNK